MRGVAAKTSAKMLRGIALDVPGKQARHEATLNKATIRSSLRLGKSVVLL